ncbi:TetR/AcrR family transcriptional regulator [Dactylosporangium sp. CS-033363]|uniref:TetR/AcrR family transcriptional regulator n=1 Tax=Dactylosporangium sp. CS-033363 TaxID=3239935 RepID=UPI003D90EA80
MSPRPVPLRDPRPPGRPPTISADDIARAALEVGFHALTMATVAQRLGVKHTSLYRHVRNRDALLVAAMDLAVRSADWPSPGPAWRPYTEAVAGRVWELFARYPGMASTIRTVSHTPPAVTDVFYRTARHLASLGFSDADAVLVVDTLTDLAADTYTGWERMTAAQHSNLREVWSTSQDAYAPIVRTIIDSDPRDWFEAKLALLLDGAATRFTRPRTPRTDRGGSAERRR